MKQQTSRIIRSFRPERACRSAAGVLAPGRAACPCRLCPVLGLAMALLLPAVGQGQAREDARAKDGPALGSPQAAALEARLIQGTRQITFEGPRTGEAYFNPDDTKLIFASEREPGNPFYQMYVMDLETGDLDRVSSGIGKTTCGWFYPDGTKVLFSSTHLDPDARAKQAGELEARRKGTQKRYKWDYDETYDIFSVDLKTRELKRLTTARGYDAEASWSPDGSKVLFASNRTAYTEPMPDKDRKTFELDKAFMVDIYIMDADGTNVRRLTTARGYDGGPFFSPDGKRICWREFSEDGVMAEVYTMNIDGTDKRQITRFGAMSWAPFYHPSGKYLVFTTNLHGFSNFELYIVDVEGRGEPVRVTYTAGFDGLPAFSNRGDRIAWTSTRAANKSSQLFMGKWNHAEALRLIEQSLSRSKSTVASPTERRKADGAKTAGTEAAIREDDLRRHVERLASSQMEGRATGSEGERLAAQYVADAFRRMGLEPDGDDGTYFQAFTFTAGAKLGSGNELTLSTGRDQPGRRELKVDRDWRPIGFSKTGRIESAGVVFAGYGIVAPKADGFEAYDSFKDLDVRNKWVMVLRGLPDGAPAARRQQLARYASLRYKAMLIRDKGARGMIVVSVCDGGRGDPLVPLALDASLAGTSLAAVSVTDGVVDGMLSGVGKTLKALQATLDRGEPVAGFEVGSVSIGARIDIEKVPRTGQNVLGRLVAKDAVAGAPWLVVGAHIDHLGHGEGDQSLAGDDEKGGIHYGADDNASGVASILEMGQYLADQQAQGKVRLKHDIVFAAWSGEELGLLGSMQYLDAVGRSASDPHDLHTKILACLNLDMVGRLGKSLILDGVGSSSVWRREIERRNIPVGLPLTLHDGSYLPTDATSFYLKGVPILSAFTGTHADYHTPRDTPEKLNYEGLKQITRFMALVARSLACGDEAPDYIVQKAPTQTSERTGLRVFLGTVPDYAASSVPGLRLTGVAKGGPAEKAGLQAGDIIVSMGGTKIENIYDYVHAIDTCKIGEPVEVHVLRGDKKVTLTLVPGSRE